MARRKAGNVSRRVRTTGGLHYIPCRVEPGMFAGEWLVYLSVVDPRDTNRTITAQLLVDERDIAQITGKPERGRPAAAWLRVSLAESEKKGLAKVVLPQPAVPIGENLIVGEELVKSAAS